MSSTGIHIQTLGITNTSKRKLVNCDAFNYLFPKSSGKKITIKTDGNVSDTVAAMRQIVKEYSWQTQQFADYLWSKSKDVPDLLANIYAWFYGCIEYREDEYGIEQLRNAARLWADKFGDCDCFSITVSCILTNLNIPHYFKVIKIKNRPNYQHVYVVVPKNGQALNGPNSYWTLDPVLDEFDREADDITGVATIGMGNLSANNTLNGLPIEVLGGVTNLPGVNQNNNTIANNLFGLGAAAVTVKRDVAIDNNQNQLPIPKDSRFIPPIDVENGINPFQQLIEITFKGTVSETIGKSMAARPATLKGEGDGLDKIDPTNPDNFQKVFESDELKKYADQAKGAVSKLNLAETKGALQKLNEGYNYLKQNQVDPYASNISNADSKPVKAFFKSGVGASILTVAGTTAGTAVAMMFTTTATAAACAGSLVCGAVAVGIAAITVAILYLFTNNAEEVISNFWDWLKDKQPNLMAFDNYEGFSVKVDVNVYGDLIRNWREQATGSKSGNNYLQYPGDYFPILASIYKNVPLAKDTGGLVINTNKVALNAQMDTGLKEMYGNEYWRTPGWMKLRAFMVTPLLAEIVYQEKYEEYKPKMMTMFAAKAINNISWSLIDQEYLNELRDTLKVQLLIARKDQITYDNQKNNTIVPAVAGSILWVGGQNKDGVAQTGFFTNQTNLGLKAGDTVYIQITGTAGAAEYTGMHKIAYLGTDDGLYTNQMFTINVPKTAGIPSNITGVFQKQEPIEPDPNNNNNLTPSKPKNLLAKIGGAALAVKLLSLLVS